MSKSQLLNALTGIAGKPQPIAPQPLGQPAPACRREKKTLMVWVDPAVLEQIKAVAYEEKLTQSALMRDAVNLMFRKHGKPEIA